MLNIYENHSKLTNQLQLECTNLTNRLVNKIDLLRSNWNNFEEIDDGQESIVSSDDNSKEEFVRIDQTKWTNLVNKINQFMDELPCECSMINKFVPQLLQNIEQKINLVIIDMPLFEDILYNLFEIRMINFEV